MGCPEMVAVDIAADVGIAVVVTRFVVPHLPGTKNHSIGKQNNKLLLCIAMKIISFVSLQKVDYVIYKAEFVKHYCSFIFLHIL